MSEDQQETLDRRVSDNSESIKRHEDALARQTKILEEILYFHKPWLKSEWKTQFRTKFYGPLLKVMAVVSLWTGAVKTGQWYWNFCKVDKMARQYVEIANQMYYGEGNPDIALEFLDKAIKLRDGRADYKFLRAYIDGLSATRLLMNLGRPYTKAELDRAHRVLAEAALLEKLEPERPEPYLLQGQILTALGELDRAAEQLSKALQIAPENEFIHVRMATLKMAKGDPDGAERSLERAEELSPNSKWMWLWKGVLANDFRKDPERARACYRKALDFDPKFDLALYNEGWTWAKGKEKDYDKARGGMLKALAVNPAYKEALYSMGMFYGYEDNYPVAKVWMDKAIALDPLFLEGYKWRGVIKWEMKDFAGALADYDAAIRLDPMNPDPYRRRAKVYTAMGQVAEAERDAGFMQELMEGRSKE